jgi:hypothetical protein
VTCPAGHRRHRRWVSTSGPGLELNEGQPISLNGNGVLDSWFVFADNFTNTARTLTVWALCVKAKSQDTSAVPTSAAGNAAR